MNRILLAAGALAVSALLIPGDAEAQRFGGRGGGGGARIGAGDFGGSGAFRGVSSPFYGYGYNYPYYGNYPTTVAYGEDCYWVRRRVVGRNGRVLIRREQVCNY